MLIYFYDSTYRYIGNRELKNGEPIPLNATTTAVTLNVGEEAYFVNGEWAINNIVVESVSSQADSSTIPLASLLQLESSNNLYNKDATDNVSGYYINYSGVPAADVTYSYSHLIPVENGHTYSYPTYSTFGANRHVLHMYDANGNFLARAYGVLDAYSIYNLVTINNASAAYVRVNVSLVDIATGIFQFVESASYPKSFTQYVNKSTVKNSLISTETLQYANPLYGKMAIFDGSSITNAASDTKSLGGWVGRIALKNNMPYKNYGVGGGSIAYISADRHCIARSVAGFRPAADYIIFEGGTNDADLIGSGNAGELSSGYDAVLDDTIFAQAMESMLKQAILKYPGKKIGYIVAHKMGTGATAANRKAYFDVAISACVKWGVKYLNLWDECHMNPSISAIVTEMYADADQHPNGEGYDYLAPIVEAWMRTI